MIKVLAISHLYPSAFDKMSGIFIEEQAKNLIQQNCEIIVIAPTPITPILIRYFKKKWVDYSKIPFKTISGKIEIYHPRYLEFPKNLSFASSGERVYLGIRKLVDKIYRNFKFNLVHAHSILPDGYAGVKIAQKYKKPLIVGVYGSDLLISPYRNKKTFINTLGTLKKASMITTVSQHLKDNCIEKFGIPEKKIRAICVGYDPNKFYFSENQPRQKEENIRILFAANVLKTKGIFDLLEAMVIIRKQNPELFKKISWIFVGYGDDMGKFKKQIKKYNLEKNVKIVGRVPHQQIRQYMDNTDFIILPSWSEGTPVVLVEATACGLPVIATGVGGIPEIINQNSGILVKPRMPIELAKGIILAVSKKWDYKTISNLAKNWTWTQNAQKTIEVFKGALNYEK
jgi:hypothetical protein